MNNIFNLYINEKSKDIFNRIFAISEVKKVPISSLIMNGIDMYIDKIDNVESLISDPILWDDIISKMDKKELEETNTLLFELNKKIMEFYGSTNR